MPTGLFLLMISRKAWALSLTLTSLMMTLREGGLTLPGVNHII